MPPPRPRAPGGDGPEDARPASEITLEFRDAIHQRESRTGNYEAYNPAGDAWGRYQLTATARKQIGLEDENGKLTGKYGVRSREEYLKNQAAQEKSFADYMEANRKLLRANGAVNYAGQKIEGVKAAITVTQSGLLAAAHRAGAATVRRYLAHQEAHGWKSNFSQLPPEKRQEFLRVETRLREFERIPIYKR